MMITLAFLAGLVFVPLYRTICWHAWQRREDHINVLSPEWKRKMVELERQ